MLANILKENNVNSQGMRFDPGARTALAFVTLRSDGEREFMFYRNPSADMLLEVAELDLDIITKVYEDKSVDRKDLWILSVILCLCLVTVFAI